MDLLAISSKLLSIYIILIDISVAVCAALNLLPYVDASIVVICLEWMMIGVLLV